MTLDQFMYKVFPVIIVIFILAGHFFKKYFHGSTDKKSDYYDDFSNSSYGNDINDPASVYYIPSDYHEKT
jgi:hypothetical protein